MYVIEPFIEPYASHSELNPVEEHTWMVEMHHRALIVMCGDSIGISKEIPWQSCSIYCCQCV